MNLFRVRGIPLAVHFSFFLLLAMVGFEGWTEAGVNGLAWNIATLVAFFTCVVLHELGHSFTAMHFGIGVRRILLLPIGGMAEFEAIPRQPRRELLITIAGPAVNFVLAALLWPWVPPYPELMLVAPYGFGGLLANLFLANVVMGCFNLLPAFPMDGGRILRALLARHFTYVRATKIAATVGKFVCVAAISAALAAPLWEISPDPLWLPVLLFTFIFIVGELEYRMVKRRELEEAHWRAIVADLRTLPPPTEEPPILLR